MANPYYPGDPGRMIEAGSRGCDPITRPVMGALDSLEKTLGQLSDHCGALADRLSPVIVARSSTKSIIEDCTIKGNVVLVGCLIEQRLQTLECTARRVADGIADTLDRLAL